VRSAIICTPQQILLDSKIKKDKIGGVEHMRDKKFLQNFSQDTRREENSWENQALIE
jgi:hypothetical protein